MASKITLKNNQQKELSIINRDNTGAKTIYGDQLVMAVDTIADMEAITTGVLDTSYDGTTCIVKADGGRNGTFVYSYAEKANDNQGTNFNGWVRQYDGEVYTSWFGVVADGTISVANTARVQAAIDAATTKIVINSKGNISLTSYLEITKSDIHLEIIEGVILTAEAQMDQMIYVYNKHRVSIVGLGKLNANDLSVNGIKCVAQAVSAAAFNSTDILIEGLLITGTQEDTQLFHGAIMIGSLDGKSGPSRYKNVKINNVYIESCGTHGVLIAYADYVSVTNCRLSNTYNHGCEGVNCTNINITNNKAINCLKSGLGVGDNTKLFSINDNIISGCAGDGSITIEHNSIEGTISNNTIVECTSQGINVSYGTASAGEFSTIHDIVITGNVITAKTGVLTRIGINVYATPATQGYNINISNNTIEAFNKLMTLSYLRCINVSGVSNNTLQGTSANLIDLIHVTESTVSNITSRANCGSDAILIDAYTTNKSRRIVVNGISTYTVNAAGNSVIKVVSGDNFSFTNINSSGALHAIEVIDAATTYHAGGIVGNYTSAFVSGGNKLVWQA